MLSSLFSKPYSRVYIVGDNADWAIDEEAKQLERTLKSFGCGVSRAKKIRWNIPQIVHYSSQFALLDESIYKSKHRISIDYFHGKPDQGESFRKCFEAIKRHKEHISRIRVSTKDMERTLCSTGIDPNKIVRIPIAVDLDLFNMRTEAEKKAARQKLHLPENEVVIGSFQKDGVGWGEGNEPKLIKGPDIFLEVIEKLKQDIPHIHVLLSGPSRGFIINGLKRLGVPCTHRYVDAYAKVPMLYDALDLYLITSREEGGPKMCLESMAKGVPLVTTEVGQCKDVVQNTKNAMMAPIDDVERLYASCKSILENKMLERTLIENGLETARENSADSQLPLWRNYFEPLIH